MRFRQLIANGPIFQSIDSSSRHAQEYRRYKNRLCKTKTLYLNIYLFSVLLFLSYRIRLALQVDAAAQAQAVALSALHQARVCVLDALSKNNIGNFGFSVLMKIVNGVLTLYFLSATPNFLCVDSTSVPRLSAKRPNAARPNARKR